MKEWWSKSSLAEFNKRSECIEEQYSKYKVQGKYPVRGSYIRMDRKPHFKLRERELFGVDTTLRKRKLNVIKVTSLKSVNITVNVAFLFASD